MRAYAEHMATSWIHTGYSLPIPDQLTILTLEKNNTPWRKPSINCSRLWRKIREDAFIL